MISAPYPVLSLPKPQLTGWLHTPHWRYRIYMRFSVLRLNELPISLEPELWSQLNLKLYYMSNHCTTQDGLVWSLCVQALSLGNVTSCWSPYSCLEFWSALYFDVFSVKVCGRLYVRCSFLYPGSGSASIVQKYNFGWKSEMRFLRNRVWRLVVIYDVSGIILYLAEMIYPEMLLGAYYCILKTSIWYNFKDVAIKKTLH